MRSEDIAKLAGVSRSTVSRVINNYANVPEATREKVLKVIEQYQYEPNSFARALAGKRTETIGLFAISWDEETDASHIYQNSYFAPFVEAVVETANALGFYVLIHTVYSKDDFLKVKQAFLQKRIDGGILVGTRKDINVVRELVELDAPLVLVDYDISEIIAEHLDRSRLSVINSMDYNGTVEAMEYLIQLGHRRIGMLCGRMNTYSGRERYAAYTDTLVKHGLPIRSEHILQGDFSKLKAAAAIRNLLASGNLPTALFAANDDMAITAMEVLTEYGLSVPQDLSLIGFDDIPVASGIAPKLSTVKLPIYEMSKAAVEKVIELCEAEEPAFSTRSLPAKLIVRESCGPANM
ncbi:LacI family transcriptional regulator [Paenibacillus sp. CAA11]|uniref:LacI family DNA-binding transcriptional regulator n=1 Tax=Paenibacillus sp. CAA11 TaxID=1532905 RepID=UPI000D3A092F|nr:LacI family DNA-binding transcriptional regulator [Paenibacillus sp. CAA11]AWB44205.1 LacI family transcriptional regulator [Paenibacillus sp. CAA11]